MSRTGQAFPLPALISQNMQLMSHRMSLPLKKCTYRTSVQLWSNAASAAGGQLLMPCQALRRGTTALMA